MSNESEMRKAVEKYRKELKAMIEDISEVDAKILTKAVNVGKSVAIKETPVGNYPSEVFFVTKEGKEVRFKVQTKQGGIMRKSWRVSPTRKIKKVVEKTLFNIADYSSFVNDGHRVVNRDRVTVGFVQGEYMLEKAIKKTETVMRVEFKNEIERINKAHGGNS